MLILRRCFPQGLAAGVLLIATCAPLLARQVTDSTRELPGPLVPFEYLIGRWKGQGVPKDDPRNRFRGWTETHTWAWVFSDGKPTGLKLSIDGSKQLEQATLTYDENTKKYHFQAKETGSSADQVVLVGTLDPTGKLLTLDRTDRPGRERLTIRANSNSIRCTFTFEHKDPGSVLFKPVVEVGLTKEGESFAAGSSVAERPKCIVTGGAASMTVTYQGQSYHICCTGCRDEFNENPEKYLKKLSLQTKDASKASSSGSSTLRVNRSEDVFSADVDAGRPEPPSEAGPAGKPSAPTARTKDVANPSKKPKEPTAKPDSLAARAATLLRLGQNLEKSGKSTAALKYYKQILKECGGTPSAKVATERVKAIEAD